MYFFETHQNRWQLTVNFNLFESIHLEQLFEDCVYENILYNYLFFFFFS